MADKRLIHVAAAVIVNPAGEILLARRPDDKHQGGLWEFPGGKVEADEQVTDALARELDEEIGIQVTEARPLIQIAHHYPDKSVLLDVYKVTGFTGEAHGREGQPVRWVSPDALADYEFPAANVPIVAAAQLPERILITGAANSADEYLQRTEAALKQGIRWVMLRTPEQGSEAWFTLAKNMQSLCDQYQAVLQLNTSVELANELGADALHLNRTRLAELESRAAFKGRWLSAACHNAQELALAEQKGVDFVTLSPVAPTASHPGEPVLGWAEFAQLTREAKVPVVALGGMAEADLESAFAHGAQGIAAISAWW